MSGTATISGRGRKPKPTKLRELNGNAGKRPLNKDEPQFTEIVAVEPPEWLSEIAVQMWQTITPELLKNKILTVADLHNVEAFCMAYARWREAENDVKINGITITTEATVIKNPAVTVVNEALKQMMQFGALLGLDPSSRTRLIGGAKKETVANPFADL
ncbi:phage terminase small subunit P27 family [Moraxella sp. ZY210820]|uniref:phage terminase small subunit P27 family n=1 Tax=unclassified Moraxella TaxID=2685852 RepID=UPI002730A22D|nr:phage terminase small subunit P27 family [Moraxella sp. ZY210820]WLF83790.1 phage terminase small subunit P27 family [Moraxella sp. ZY210820]